MRDFEICEDEPAHVDEQNAFTKWQQQQKKRQSRQERLQRKQQILKELKEQLDQNESSCAQLTQDFAVQDVSFCVAQQRAQAYQVGSVYWAKALLGLSDTSVTTDTVKKFYRNLARQWHPDTCKTEDKHFGQEAMIALGMAVEILTQGNKKHAK